MLIYATGSKVKFEMANGHLKNHGIKLIRKKINVSEIQSESIKEIAIDKAKKIYGILKKPIFVNDSGWFFEGLNGFPGAFMAYINKWLTADDLIRLMKGKKNRKVILKQVLVYTDGKIIKTFEHDSIGKVLPRPSKHKGRPSEMIVSFSKDNLSLTDKRAKNLMGLALEAESELWHEFASWLNKNKIN